MNKMICTFLALSSFSSASFADNQHYRMPRNSNVKVATVKYNEDAGNDFNTWLSNIDNAVRPVIETQYDKIFAAVLADKSLHDVDSKANTASIALSRLEEQQIVDVWNKIIQRYPNSKNARSALCRYAKEIAVLHADVKKCDKDFQLNPSKQFVYRRDLKALQAPKLD